MPPDARETESEKRIRNTLNKPCRVELQSLQAEIVIIDPKPYQSNHFHRLICPWKAKYR